MTGFKCPSYLSFISHLSPHHYSFAMLLHYYYLIILNILLIFSLPIFSYFSFPLFLLLSFFVPLSLSFLSSSLLPSLPPLTFHVRRCVLHATILNSRAEAYGDMLEGDVIAEMTLHNPQLVKVIDSYSLPCFFSTLIVLFCLLFLSSIFSSRPYRNYCYYYSFIFLFLFLTVLFFPFWLLLRIRNSSHIQSYITRVTFYLTYPILFLLFHSLTWPHVSHFLL